MEIDLLTCMSHLSSLIAQKVYRRWVPIGHAKPAREVYYNQVFSKSLRNLDHKAYYSGDGRDVSEAGCVKGLLSDIARGTALRKLSRPVGFGMDPMIKRMDSPRQVIIELRTPSFENRTMGARILGFSRKPNEFFAALVIKKGSEKRSDSEPDPLDPVLHAIMDLIAPFEGELDCTTDAEQLIIP